MNREVLEEYKKLSDNIKNKVNEMSAYNACYERDKNMSDDMVIFITSLAKDCWLKDEYSRAGIVDYVDYILQGVYEYGATKNELDNISCRDIVEGFNCDYEFEDLLKFDLSDYEYAFETTEDYKYYCKKDDEGYYVVRSDDRLIKSPNPMDNDVDTLFNLLEENKIKHISYPLHYTIRKTIKDDYVDVIEDYPKGIENYKKYCLDRFITSEDILKKLEMDNDNISLTEIDGQYTQIKKMDRLAKYFHNIDENGKTYSYVASLSNGTDYYYKEGRYIALDKNNVVKNFPDTPNFILNELHKKDKIVYLTDDEIERIKNNIENDYKNLNISKKDNIFSVEKNYKLDKFMEYVNNKELNNLFSSRSIYSTIELYKSMSKTLDELKKSDIKKRMQKVYENNDKGFDLKNDIEN